MTADKTRFDKIMALAINPGAPDGEALAAFSMLRKLVRENPSLTAPPTPPSSPAPPPTDASRQWRVTKLPPFWLPIAISNLSERAFQLGLRSKFVHDFTEYPAAVTIRCEGAEEACQRFEASLEATIEWTNAQPPDPSKV